MENKIDDLFKKKISSFEVMPSANAWGRIEGQLDSSKRKLWYRRFAVAASVVLLAGITYIGFKSIDSVSVSKINQRTDAQELSSVKETNNNEEKNSAVEIQTPIAKTETTLEDVTAIKHEVDAKKGKSAAKSQTSVKQSQTIKPIEKETDKVDLPAVISKEVKEESGIEVFTEASIPEQITEDVITDKTEIVDQVTAKEKSYPQVTITYKSSKQPGTAESGKKGLLSKGLNKLTEFTDEHVLTEERKTKLRNTTEDLLALNFGKLLNKSNREFEN